MTPRQGLGGGEWGGQGQVYGLTASKEMGVSKGKEGMVEREHGDLRVVQRQWAFVLKDS